jgi:hypothetical protein
VIGKVRRFRTAVAALIVVVAGSFVRFLVETHGKDKFRRLHALTPFRPGERIVYGPARYRSVYGTSLAGLASQWRAAIGR